MADNQISVVPAPRDDFVELARTPSGKLFRKHILAPGVYPHPADRSKKLKITPEKVDRMIENFESGVCDIVQVPKVNASNVHVEDPDRNIGEVIRLEKRKDGGADAIIDARSEEDAKRLGKTLLGASAMYAEDYTDNRSGERVGPTLLHVAITNRPFLNNLEPFEEIVAASARADTDSDVTVYASQEDTGMPTQEELIQSLRDEFGIDVEELQNRAETAQAALSADDVIDALVERGIVQLSNGDDADEPREITPREVAEAAIELSNTVEAQSQTIAALEAEAEKNRRTAAEREVDDLVEAGRVLPKQRDKFVEFAMNDRDTFAALLPEDSVVSLSEKGVTVHEDPSESDETEIARLTAVAEHKPGEK